MNRKNRVIVAAGLLAALSAPCMAQSQNSSLVRDGLLSECRALFSGGNYEQTAKVLERIDGLDSRSGQDVTEELDYMRAVVSAKTNLVRSSDALSAFQKKYPQSIYRDRILSLQGMALMADGEFASALDCFDECDVMRLGQAERQQTELQHAIALFRCGNIDEGLRMLDANERIGADTTNPDGVFYRAYADYLNGQTDKAKLGFRRSLNGKHDTEARLYLAEIDAGQGKPQTVAVYLDEIKPNASDSSVNKEIDRLMGEYWYRDGNSEKAIGRLEAYVLAADSLAQPYDLYLLGMSYYNRSDWENAIKYLAVASEGNDETAQNAAFHMGLAALKSGNKDLAGMAFQRATAIPGRDDVREKAMFNYAMVLQEASYSPFAESVTVLEGFLNDYPKSAYADRAASMLAQEYLHTSNYEAALKSIDRIKNPDRTIMEAKQKLLYRQAMDMMADGLYPEIPQVLTKAIGVGSYDQDVMDALYFWRGESYYRVGNMQQAELDYSRYLSRTSGRKAAYTDMAEYGLGYILFNDGNYQRALDYFRRTSSMTSTLSDEMVSDAMLRAGDCQLNLRMYEDAIESYRKSMDKSLSSNDYAMFQYGTVCGLMQRYPEKIEWLERVVNDCPTSQYVPSALFEIGRCYQQTGSPEKSVSYFKRITDMYPTSDLARRATVEMALVYYQTDKYDEAIEMYKKVIADYPGSDEARTAMADLKSIYVEKGDVSSFVNFSQSTPSGSVIAVGERDSLSYAAAESMFRRGDMDQALSLFHDYTRQFPDGAFLVDAWYYSAVIYQRQNDYERAMDNYLRVAGRPNNRFCQEALQQAASMSFAAGDWETALDTYMRLYELSLDAGTRQSCLVGIVLSAGQIDEYDAVLEYADAALATNPSRDRKNEISYWKAKALLAADRKADARPILEELSGDTRSRFGAEADYLLSQLLFDSGDTDAAQTNVMALVREGTPHTYWLARSFILLSDIYSSQGKDVEARQYLLSLKSNYTENDDIAQMIEERLK